MKLTTNEILVMACLIDGAKYGLQIVNRIKESPQLKLNEGSLYNVLARLEKREYVTGFWGSSTTDQNENRRHYYKLTGSGKIIINQFLDSLNFIAFQRLA